MMRKRIFGAVRSFTIMPQPQGANIEASLPLCGAGVSPAHPWHCQNLRARTPSPQLPPVAEALPFHGARGSVLVMVLVMVALASMIAASLLYRMNSEVSAAAASGNGEQAYQAALSGIARSLSMLAGQADVLDNPDMLQNQLVQDDGATKWYFTVYAGSGDQKQLRYGLEDEAGKINLNAMAAGGLTLADTTNQAGATILKNLLGRFSSIADTDELADCLIDYIDRDSTPGPKGAEQDYYDKLSCPYLIKNARLASVEELLLVKGFDARIVYGEDANLSSILDPNEDDGDKNFPPDNSDGQLDCGLLGLATVASYERNVDSQGQNRININGNGEELAKLDSAGLNPATVNFIKMYRAEGNQFSDASQLLQMSYTLKTSQTAGSQDGGRSGRGGRRPPRGTGSQASSSQPEAVPAGSVIESGVDDAQQLELVLDKLAIRSGGSPLSGLVNLNTADAEVLRCIPGIDENLASSIVTGRVSLDSQKKTAIAWLFGENLVDAQKFKEIAPYLTARSYQYRIRCVGFGVPCGRYRILEAVVDLAGSSPRIAYLRDITRLGLPAAMDTQAQEHSN